jgi:hypothetical protein
MKIADMGSNRLFFDRMMLESIDHLFRLCIMDKMCSYKYGKHEDFREIYCISA